MPRKSAEPDKTKQLKANFQMVWRVLILVVIAYVLAKFFKVPLPF